MANTTVGEAIRKARESVEPAMSQRDLGDAAGVLAQEISRYERGVTVPPVYRVRAIARATGQPMTFFYGPDYVDRDDGGVVSVGTEAIVSNLRYVVRDELRYVMADHRGELERLMREAIEHAVEAAVTSAIRSYEQRQRRRQRA